MNHENYQFAKVVLESPILTDKIKKILLDQEKVLDVETKKKLIYVILELEKNMTLVAQKYAQENNSTHKKKLL